MIVVVIVVLGVCPIVLLLVVVGNPIVAVVLVGDLVVLGEVWVTLGRYRSSWRTGINVGRLPSLCVVDRCADGDNTNK